MALWKKITAVIVVLILFFTIGIVLFIRSLPDPCSNEVITEVISPNRKMKSVTFQRDCGATTDFSTHVVIIPVESTLEKAGSSIFVATTNKGKAPAGRGGGPEVRTRWLSADKLQIEYHQLASVRRSETKSMGMEILYGTFQ